MPRSRSGSPNFRAGAKKDVAKAIAAYSDRKRTEALSALEEHAKALGFSLAELTGKKVRKTRSGSR